MKVKPMQECLLLHETLSSLPTIQYVQLKIQKQNGQSQSFYISYSLYLEQVHTYLDSCITRAGKKGNLRLEHDDTEKNNGKGVRGCRKAATHLDTTAGQNRTSRS